MQAELTDKISENRSIREISRTALVVALVCTVMPFINITTNDTITTFSLYDFMTKFYKSDIAKSFPETAKGLITVIKIMGWSITFVTAFGLGMLFSKNKATQTSDNTRWTFIASIVATALVFLTYFYICHVITEQSLSDANRYTYRARGIAMIVAYTIAFMALLIRRVKKRLAMAAILILLVIPATIAFGILFMNDRQYYFISMMIIIETMIPFFMIFEQRKTRSQRVGSHCGFSSYCRGRTCSVLYGAGSETGLGHCDHCRCLSWSRSRISLRRTDDVRFQYFLWSRAMDSLANVCPGVNRIFWQEFFFKKADCQKKRLCLCIFGFFCTLIVYGFIMDTCTIMTMAFDTSTTGPLAYYISGLPFNIVYGTSTFFFLWVLANPMIEKLDRIKKKYGMMEP